MVMGQFRAYSLAHSKEDLKNENVVLSRYSGNAKVISCSEKERSNAGQHGSTEEYVVLSRKVVIEPALTLAAMFGAFWYQLVVQYHLFAIGEKYNLTAILEAEKEEAGNITLPGHNEGACDLGSTNKNSTGYELQQRAQAEAAIFDLWLSVISNIPGFVFLLFFGTLMDQVGYRPILILAGFEMLLQTVIYIVQQLLSLPLEFLYLSGLLEACMGGFPTFVAASYAYLMNTVPPKSKAKRLTLLDIMTISGISLTGFAMGVAIQKLGFLWPFIITFIGHFVNLCYVVFFVPETRQGKPNCKSISVKYILQSFNVLVKKRSTRKALLVFVVPWMLSSMTYLGGWRFYPTYKLNSPFCWTPSMLGAYDALGAIIGCMTQLCASMLLFSRMKEHAWIIILSLAFWIFYNVTIASASSSWVIWFALIFQTCWTMSLPIFKSIASTLVTPNEQGALFSTLLAFEKITVVAGSIVFSNVYASTLYFFKGTVFIVMSFFLLIAVAFTLWFIHIQKQQRQKEDKTDDKTLDKF